MKRVSLWTVWKLRLKLWWMFGFEEWKNGMISHHRLKIRWNRSLRMWDWVCEVQAKMEASRLPSQTRFRNGGMWMGKFYLGPLQQWTLQEALSLAARKAEWVQHPDQEPVKEPEPNAPVPKHNKVYRLMDDGKFSVECACGWKSEYLRCHGELTAPYPPTSCRPCGLAEKSYDDHEFEQAKQKLESVCK